ncbi:protein translocase subunit SecF [bacterium]|nr:protein translocase subunit SecF [bacterium]
MMHFFKTPNIDFISKRKPAYVVSALLILIGIAATIIRGGYNYSIDFKGGTSVAVGFKDEVKTEQIRRVLGDAGFGGCEIKKFGGGNEYLIYVEQQKDVSAQDVAERIQQAFHSDPAIAGYELRQIDTVGPKIGKELRSKAVWAILVSLALILTYVAIRYEFIFAVAAVAAVFHDVLVVLGFFPILNWEISLKEIAAFLTIVGYSLNDTIVIFDRLRENAKLHRNENLAAVMNRSLNETLSRTIITALTVFTVCLILFLFGGEVIRGFSFAMLLGTIVGCYSTVFVASPIAYEYYIRKGIGTELKMAKRKK